MANNLWINLDLDELATRGETYLKERIAHYQELSADPMAARFRAAVETTDGELEMDADAVVSTSYDGGAYVMVWQWVSNEEIEEDGDAE